MFGNSSSARAHVADAVADPEADSDDDDDNKTVDLDAAVAQLDDDHGDEELFADPFDAAVPPVAAAVPPVAAAGLPAHPIAQKLLMDPQRVEVSQFIYSCVIESSIRGRCRAFSNTHNLLLPCVAPLSLVR